MGERSDLACITAQDWMEEQADGRLDPPREATLRAHLAACEECREALEDVTAVRPRLATAIRPECPESVVTRILHEIDEEASRAAVSGPAPGSGGLLDSLRRFVGGPIWRPVAVMGAATLFLALMLETERHLPSPTSSPGIDVGVATAVEDEELKQAVAETRLAFAIFARTLNDTGERVGREVRTRLAAPMMRGIQEGFERIPPPIQSPEPEDGAVLPEPGTSLRT